MSSTVPPKVLAYTIALHPPRVASKFARSGRHDTTSDTAAAVSGSCTAVAVKTTARATRTVAYNRMHDVLVFATV
jgi:hypothetical protein